jgi:branched-chain amino acid transport system ATP-binding protein
MSEPVTSKPVLDTPVSGEPVLRTENLTKRFGGLVAVDDLSIALAGGRVQAIIGPNGAGKTTFFNLVTGLLRPDSGRIFFRGDDITGARPHVISRLGIKRTLQVKSVFPDLSVADNLWITRQARHRFLHPFRPASSDKETRLRVEETLEQIGLADLAARPAGTLSYGDVAMLEIGMAIISEPRLLLLDEPTCGMSPAETARAVGKIRELSRTIDLVIIEHDMDVVFGIADDITVLAQGAILASGGGAAIAEDERVREAYLGRPEDEDFVEEALNA